MRKYKINVIYSLFGLLNDNLGHHYVTILLAKMLIWAPFSQSMCTFYFCIYLSYTYTYIYMYMYTCIHICLHVYIHIHVYLFKSTYISLLFRSFINDTFLSMILSLSMIQSIVEFHATFLHFHLSMIH